MGLQIDKLKFLRLSKGLLQKDVARALGISTQAYSLYEKGLREPNLDTLEKLAAFFGVTPNELIGWTDDSSQEKNTSDIIKLFSGYEGLKTLAAHFDGVEYTIEELDEIAKFAEFVKSKRRLVAYSGQLDAVQERTDIDVTEEMKHHDENIMDDENC